MNAIEMIKERRSVRKFQDKKVSREIMTEIVELSRWAPSWANFQVAKYTFVDDEAMVKKLIEEALLGYNKEKLKSAKGLVVLSVVNGESGSMKGKYLTSKGGNWEIFDAGIACQTFCLAAHAKGIATCIVGGSDEKITSEIVGFPEDETVAALIAYGYEEGEHAEPSPRKAVDEIMHFV